MAWISDPHILLTVRGKTIPTVREDTIALHNQTAGSEQGVAAARALGDLSHNVFTPLAGVPGAEENELLFIDVWKNAEGLMTFFSDEQVQKGAAMMFSEREAAVWMPAEDGFGFDLPPTTGKTERFVGLARGPVSDPAQAVAVDRQVLAPGLSEARRHGQLSHQVYISAPMPGGSGPTEMLGVDVWSDAAGMGEYYASLSGFEAAYSDEPQTSVWQQGTGGSWTEW